MRSVHRIEMLVMRLVLNYVQVRGYTCSEIAADALQGVLVGRPIGSPTPGCKSDAAS